MSAFDEWYNGMVGFHINSERILDNLQPEQLHGYAELDPVKLRKWMVVCWNNALDAALNATAEYDTYNELFGLAAELENLKEKP